MFLGPLLQASVNAVAPLFKNGPVEFTLPPSDFPQPGGWRFSAVPSVDDDAIAIVRYLRLRGLTRIGVITATDAAGQVLDRSFAAAFSLQENRALTEVAHEHFNYSDLSVAAQMARLKAAAPQALIAWATGSPLGLLLHGVQDAGLDVPVVAGNGAMTYVQMEQYRDFLPQELLFPGLAQELLAPGSPTKARDPVSRVRGQYSGAFAMAKIRPDYGQSLMWDAALLAIDILRHVGPEGSPEAARTYLANLHDWPGIFGLYDYRNGKRRGVGVDAIAMVRWDPSKQSFVAVTRPGAAVLR